MECSDERVLLDHIFHVFFPPKVPFAGAILGKGFIEYFISFALVWIGLEIYSRFSTSKKANMALLNETAVDNFKPLDLFVFYSVLFIWLFWAAPSCIKSSPLGPLELIGVMGAKSVFKVLRNDNVARTKAYTYYFGISIFFLACDHLNKLLNSNDQKDLYLDVAYVLLSAFQLYFFAPLSNAKQGHNTELS